MVQPLLHIRLGQPHVGYGVELAETHMEAAGRGIGVFTQLSLWSGDDPRAAVPRLPEVGGERVAGFVRGLAKVAARGLGPSLQFEQPMRTIKMSRAGIRSWQTRKDPKGWPFS